MGRTQAERHGDRTTRRRGDASPRLSSSRFRQGGWTLIELIITLTILTILSVGIIPLVKTSVKRYHEYQLREALREMRDAIKEFHRDTVQAPCCPVNPAAPPQPGIDPRSKVAISDRTIFGVENMDHYPPTLEALVEGVNVVPRAAVGGGGGVNVNGNANVSGIGGALISTKKKVYLRAIPVDPMTGKAEWSLRSSYDSPDASDWGGENVFDVRSKSTATALDGSKYNEW